MGGVKVFGAICPAEPEIRNPKAETRNPKTNPVGWKTFKDC